MSVICVSKLDDLISDLMNSPTLVELVKSYRQACRICHPDLHIDEERSSAEEQMKQINAAYEQALFKFNIYNHIPQRTPNTEFTQREYSETYGLKPDDVECERLFTQGIVYLQKVSGFFSLTGVSSAEDHQFINRAIFIFDQVMSKYPSSESAKDALHYMALGFCNLRRFELALDLFALYFKRYPKDLRNTMFHFYVGLCFHRLEKYSEAANSYLLFMHELEASKDPRFKAFAGLAKSYFDNAKQSIIPALMPFGQD